MKQLVLKYNKVTAIFALIFTIAFVVSCSDDEDDSPVVSVEIATVDNYFPSSGKEGSGTIIQGTNFSVLANENKVLFNGVEAVIRSATRTTLLVTVPVGATTGSVSVSVNGATEVAGSQFTVLLPTIDVLDPALGGVGETVIITGTNFSTMADENKVWFNDVEATVTESTETTLTTTVPTGTPIGNGLVSVQVKNGTVITGPEFRVTNYITLKIPVTDPNDDVEEAETNDFGVQGQMDLGSSDLEMGEIDGGFGKEVIGVRFRDVNIPVGSTIVSATIVFMCDDTGSGPVNLRIHGENVGNSPENTATPFNTTSRPKTTASVLWSVAPWLVKQEKGPDQTTVDLATIVQEIVNRGDWTASNSMNFIFTQEGANSPTGGNGREAETFGGAGQEEEAPVLTIVYE